MRDRKLHKWFYLLWIIPIIWLALLVAPSISGGLPQIILDFPKVINNPFKINWCNDSLKTIFLFSAIYLLIIILYLNSEKNYRRREEHGSAKWGNIKEVNKKYQLMPINQNKILTENIRLGLDGRIHRRNVNIIVCGGSGAGKTRFFGKPNIMQCNTSFVVLDPKGEIIRSLGNLLISENYEVKVLETDAGRTTPTGEVDLNLMKALLSMDAFKKVYGGDNKIRQIQQYLNKNYEAYIGLRPCDGIYSRSTNAALIYALQAEEGLPIGTANGNFGPTTQRCCPSIPYNNVEKSYNGSTYSGTKIGKMILLLKFGLYFNGFNPFNQIDLDIQDVIYDDKTISTLKQFQNHYKLFPDGKSDLSTWLAIFVSCGDTSRSCDASDTRFEMTDDRIQYLKNNNISIVGRYLTGGDFKQLRTGEAERILANGLSFFPIFQESGTNLTYFTPERGIQDAQTATLAAKSYKIPRGSIIYFAVDTDPQDAEIYNYILPYFKALRNEMYNNLDGYYKIGIYATRNASNQVINKGYALTCFVSDMSTGFSGNMGFKIPHNWNLDQFYEIKSISTSSGIWDLDKVAYSGKFPVVTSLDVESENENNGLIILKNKLLQLYDYAETYLINAGRSHTTKECNMLVLNYLRSPDYSGNLWTMTAGEIDYGFINYIDSFNDTTLHPYNILIPTEYGNMGITHLAATLNSLQANLLVVNSTVDDLSGWAGDLLQLGCVYCGLTDEETAVNTEDLYLMIACQDDALANKYLGKDGSLHSATELGFSLEDWEQDIDAVSINKELNKEKKIYDAFYDYYTIFYEERYINIVNEIIDYENCESLQEKLLEKVKYYTHLNHLASVVFVDHFSEEYGDYSKSKIADALAEQFVNKLWYYYNR